jgi:hypothetical protein
MEAILQKATLRLFQLARVDIPTSWKLLLSVLDDPRAINSAGECASIALELGLMFLVGD